MTPEELESLFEKLRNGITMTDAELKKLQESLGGWKAFSAVAQAELKKGAVNSGKTLGRFATDVENNAKGFSQLNPIIDSVSGAMGEMAKAIPYLGNVISGTLKLVAEGSKFTLTQIDKTASAFTDLGKVGALTAKGMSGIQDQFRITGLTLDDFKKTITENANALAAFRGTTARGADDFSKVVGSLLNEKGEFKKLGTELKKLGMTPELIGDAAADFIKVQSQLGIAQKQDYKQLALGMHEYAKEMDEVTRLTGMTAKEQRAARDEAMRDSQFRAKIDQMLASGDAKQIESARQLDIANRLLVKEAPDLAKALRSMASGFAGSTEESAQAFNATGGVMQTLVEQLSSGQITDVVDFMNRLKGAVGQNITQVQSNALAVGDANSAYTKYYQLSNFYNKQWVRDQGEVRAEQQAAINTQDQLTKDVIKAQEELQEMNRRITNFAFKAMPYASEAVVEFTSTMNSFIKKFSKVLGIEMPEVDQKTGARTSEKEATASLTRKVSMWTMLLGGTIAALGGLASATGIGAAAGLPMMTTGMSMMGVGAVGATAADTTGFAEGGISTGPASGHMELLHGTEAVVPLSGGRSIPVTIKGGGPQASESVLAQQLRQFSNVLPPATKSMIGFTEALNKFTDSVTAKQEEPKDESLITKAVNGTINFIQDVVKDLFGESTTGGSARYTGGGRGGAPVGPMEPGGPRGPVSASLYEQTQDAINKGVRYGFGSKDVSSGKIDCSGWVASINTNMMESINKEAGKEIYGKQARQAMQGSAADIIKNVAAATGQMMTGEDVNLQNLKEGMTIGMDTGEHGWDKGRFEGIDHIVQVIKDAEGKLKVSESTGTNERGGVKMTDLNEWLENAKKSGARLFATDPTKMAQGAGTGYDTGPGGAAFGNPAAGRRGASMGAPTDMSTYMKTVAMLESGGNPNARASTSSAGGLFGFLKSSYEDVTGRKGMGEERFDPQKSAEAMKILTMQNKAQMEKNLGRQLSGEDLYMGHFLGAGGATKFLQQKDINPNASAAAAMPAEAEANRSIYYKDGGQARTMAEVYELMTSKYRKQQEAVMSGQQLPSLVAGLSMEGPSLAGSDYTPGAPTVPMPGRRGRRYTAQPAPAFASPFAGGYDTAMAGPAPTPVMSPQSADLSTIVATLQASNESTQTTIKTSMSDMTTQLRDIMSNTTGTGTDTTQLATLLQQIVDGQRDQITVMNRLLQVNQA